MPLPTASQFNGSNTTERQFKEALVLLLDYISTLSVDEEIKTLLSNKVNSGAFSQALILKADKQFVIDALAAFQNGAVKVYATLELANADIANIDTKTKVSVLDEINGGDYYKPTEDAEELLLSPYSAFAKSQKYINDEINKLGITQENIQDDISVSITDEDYKRTWLEADLEGLPTEYAKEKIKEKIGLVNNDFKDISVSITDEDYKRTWLEANMQGLPTEYALECIRNGLGQSPENSGAYFKSTYNDKNTKIVSGPDITCIGDSMTRGAGATNPYSYYLQQLFISNGINSIVRNCGVGGESSETICARLGGNPFLVKVNSGKILATAGQLNPISFIPQGGTTVAPTPLLQGSGNPFEDINYFKGELYGISGQIHPHPTEAGYVFVRDQTGTDVTADRPTYFYTNYSKELRETIAIIWVGQNSNIEAGLDDARAIQDAKAIARHLSTLEKRYLVINKPISTPDEDKKWFAEFGDRYIPARAYMIEYGMQDAGLTPTQQDLDSMAAGYIANSLRFDNVHWNDHGYKILANLIFKKFKQLGWL